MKKDFFLCFVHPEKCGGSTVDWVLKTNFPDYYSLSANNNKTFEGIVSKEQLALMQRWPVSIGGIGGHKVRSNAGYEQVVVSPVKYISILREPLSRMLSHLSFRKQRGIQVEVEDYISKPYHHNFMCYRLCGQQSFEAAKAEIDNMSCVMLMEDFARSMLLLRQGLDLPQMDVRYQVINQGKGFGAQNQKLRMRDLSARWQQALYDHNAEDLKLYHYLKEEVFPRQVANYSGDLEADTRELEAQLPSYRFPTQRLWVRKLKNGLVNRVIQRWAHDRLADG